MGRGLPSLGSVRALNNLICSVSVVEKSRITDLDISEEHSVCMLQDYFVSYLNTPSQNEYVGITSLSSEMKVCHESL